MKALKELKERVWFRFLKVLYLALYLPFILILFFRVSEYREYHPEFLPSSIPDALLDPKFKSFDSERKREILSKIDMDFSRLPNNEQNKIINMELTPVDYDPFRENDTNTEAVKRRGPWEKHQSSKPSPRDIIWDAPKTYREVTGNIQLDAPPTYNYSSYYTWQIKEAFYFAIIFSLAYFVVMEAIKRAFYYVVIGKVFPKN